MANSSISSSTKFGASLNLGTPGIAQGVALVDVNGNVLRTSDDGASGGTSFLGGAVPLLTMASAAYTTSDSPKVFSTAGITYGALDISVTAITGGATSPGINFFLERLGNDGVWYQILTTSGVVSAPTTISVDLSPALTGAYQAPPSSAQQHCVFTASTRLRWTFVGGTPPTSVTFSASFVGR